MNDNNGSDRDSIPASAGAEIRILEICNKKGLHARASAKFCQIVERYDADVRVSRGHESVGGTSIMGLMMLGAAMGDSITIHADGEDAEAALARLVELVEDRFGEE
jgi:phosphocarrier protein